MNYANNVKNTALFIASARIALRDSILENKNINESDKNKMIDFILEKANAAEIMSLLMEGKDQKIAQSFAIDARNPDNKCIAESFIGAGLTKLFGSNYNFIAKNFGENIANELLGLTFDYDYDKISKLNEIKKIESLSYTRVLNESIAYTRENILLEDFDMNAIHKEINDVLKSISDAVSHYGSEIKTIMTSKIPDAIKSFATEFYKEIQDGSAVLKADIAAGVKKLEHAVGIGDQHEAGFWESTIKTLEAKLDALIALLKSFFASVWDLIKHPGQIVDDTVKIYHNFIKDIKWVLNNKAEAFDMLKNSEYFKEGSMILGAAAIAAVVIYAATKIYARNFSKFAKQCKTKEGKEKTLCITDAKKNAYKAEIAALKKTKNACSKAKKPDKCKKKIDKQIASLNKSMAKL